LIDELIQEREVFKLIQHFFQIGVIALEWNVVPICLEYTIILAFYENLACLHDDCFKMSRTYCEKFVVIPPCR
jgi:hypothetical protein